VTVVPIAPFAPDMPDIPSGASDGITNVVPLTSASYGPLPSFVPFAPALAGRCIGAFAATDIVGSLTVFAGTSDKLYRLPSPGTTLGDVSQVGGYTTGSDASWRFTQFGDRIIAVTDNHFPQSYREGTSSLFEDMITTGSTTIKARLCATVKDWVVLGRTTDATFGNTPQRVWWSAINDPTNFPAPGTAAAITALSDYQDVVGQHGVLKAIVGNLGTAHAGLFFESAVYRMVFSGLPSMFDITPVEGARGLLAEGAVCQFGARAYYVGEDGLYVFNGSESAPIGSDRVNRFFFSDLRSDYKHRITSVADPVNGMIFWAYPGAGSVDGIANRLMCYSPSLDRFTVSSLDAVSIEVLFRGGRFGIPLDSLDAYGNIDTLPFSLDSDVWIGGQRVLGGFDSNHQYGFLDGPALPATVDTTDLEIASGRQAMVTRIRPLIDSASAKIAVCSRDSVAETPTFSKAKLQESNGSVPVRSRGRYHRFRVQTVAGEAWTQISGVDVEKAQIGGTR